MANNETKIVITAQTAQAEASLRTLGASVGNVSSSFFNLAGVAGTLGGALSLTAFAGIIKGSIDAADRLNDLSKVTGLLPSQLAGIGFAAQQSGSDLEGAAKAISKLSENIGKDADKFSKIGITAKDPIEAFKQLADVFNSIENPQQRAAFGAEALGKSWKEVAPLLSEGSKAIGEMVDKGTAMAGNQDELSKKSDQFKDSLDELQKRLAGAGNSLANELLPGMIATVDELNKLSESGTNFLPVGDAIRVVFETFVVVGANVGYTFKQIGNEIGGIAAQLMALASGDFKGASSIGKMMKEDAERARKEIDAFSERILNPQQNTATAAPKGNKVDTRGVAGFIGKPGGASKEKNDPFKLENEAWVRSKEFQIAEQKRAADELDKINGDMRTSALEAQAIIFNIDPIAKASAEWEKLTALKEQGLLTDEQVAKSYAKTFGEIDKSGTDAFKSLENAVRGWGNQFTDEMTKMVRTGKLNFSSLADSIINDLLRMQIQKNITEPLLTSGTGFLGDLFGGMFGAGGGGDYSSVAPGALSFAGGGFTGAGSRSGGIDGKGGFPAILHPNETVIDHTLGQGTRAPNIVIQVTNNGQPVSARQQGGPQFNGSDWVIGVVLEAADSNPHFRNAMGMSR